MIYTQTPTATHLPFYVTKPLLAVGRRPYSSDEEEEEEEDGLEGALGSEARCFWYSARGTNLREAAFMQ